MTTDQNDFLNVIHAKITELLAEEIGPVAHILCEEVREEWEKGLLEKGHKPALRYIHIYIHKLSLLIEDPQNRQNFLDSVFQIDALTIFSKS